MHLLIALEYKADQTFSITAVNFSKIVWRGVTVDDWELQKYCDLFYMWNRDDLVDFDKHHLNISLFKCPDYNPTLRRYTQEALDEILDWANASRFWIYTGHDFDFSTIIKWTPATK